MCECIYAFTFDVQSYEKIRICAIVLKKNIFFLAKICVYEKKAVSLQLELSICE